MKELITGDDLARKVKLNYGTSQYSDGGWLKFSYKGKVEFVAKKPFRCSISWQDLYSANLVYGNNVIEIKGFKYKVRLMKGKAEGWQNDQSAFQGDICKNSEWNKLMLPIHRNAPSNWAFGWNVNSPTENWNIRYTDGDIIIHNNLGNGSYAWCQEYGDSKDKRVARGGFGVSCSNNVDYYYSYKYCGWRPVLELIE